MLSKEENMKAQPLLAFLFCRKWASIFQYSESMCSNIWIFLTTLLHRRLVHMVGPWLRWKGDPISDSGIRKLLFHTLQCPSVLIVFYCSWQTSFLSLLVFCTMTALFVFSCVPYIGSAYCWDVYSMSFFLDPRATAVHSLTLVLS